MAKIRAAFVLPDNVEDLSLWAGIPYFFTRQLRQIMDLHLVCPLPGYRESLATRLAILPTALKVTYYRKFAKKIYEGFRDPALLKIQARQAQRRLKDLHVDLIISTSSLPYVYLDTQTPTLFWTDATFGGMLDFYQLASAYAAPALRHGHFTENAALQNASAAVYASQWAADSAQNLYQADPQKLHVIPFGANLDSAPAPADITAAIDNRPRSHCDLLFLGVEWQRKGGPLALQVTQKLNAMGLKTTLHLVGLRQQPPETALPCVQFHGYISKRTPEGAARLNRLFANSHFLIVPSIAECFGCVFAEASAFALPSISRAVGGIPSAIRNGRNGQLFPPTATADAYAHYLHALFSDYNRYRELARSSRQEFDSRLNWNVACQSLTTLAETMI